MSIDRAVVLSIPETPEGSIAGGAEWTIYDEHAKTFIITATKMRLEVDLSRPEVVLFTEELVGRDGERLRAQNVGGKYGTINESQAFTEEYVAWAAKGGAPREPFDGEIYNLKEFRYLVHRIIHGFPVSAFTDTASVDPASVAYPPEERA